MLQPVDTREAVHDGHATICPGDDSAQAICLPGMFQLFYSTGKPQPTHAIRDLRKRHVQKCHPSVASPAKATATSKGNSHGNDRSTSQTSQNSQNNLHQPADSGADLFASPDISWLFRLPQYIAAYFDKFHPTLPMLHQPTFDMASAKEPLLQAIACLGGVCHSPTTDHRISVTLFEAGYASLNNLTNENHANFRKIWVIQTYVLLEYFAIYSCREDLFSKALDIHRRLVDASREYQMFQDGGTLHRRDSDQNGYTSSALGGFLSGLPDSQVPESEEKSWQSFVEHESQKRAMYTLYYLDAQLANTCNMRPLLSALEIKYELPCPDNCWATPTASAWYMLVQAQSLSFPMNEEDDSHGNPDPRPANGDLYESLMYLIRPDQTVGGQQPLGLLWYSPFASLMLIVQIQMMIRDLTLASVFFYTNLRPRGDNGENRHYLSMISEENRVPIFQALSNLAELIPKAKRCGAMGGSPGMYRDGVPQAENINRSLWHSFWVSWHYAAMTLTHHDALLATGMVEHGLPTALSTYWELGKPRAKYQRDIYADRDVIRIVDNLEQVIELLNAMGRPKADALSTSTSASTASSTEPAMSPSSQQCLEDPFITMLGFKACMSGWRVVRLMVLSSDRAFRTGGLSTRPSIFTSSAQIVLERLREAMASGCSLSAEGAAEIGTVAATYEKRYLMWTSGVFSRRDTWPIGAWMVAMFKEMGNEVT